MGAYQYCECGIGLNPTDEEKIDGYVDCPCGERNEIAFGEDLRSEVMKDMLIDIAKLKEAVKKLGIDFI
jgi:hypothetical protein